MRGRRFLGAGVLALAVACGGGTGAQAATAAPEVGTAGTVRAAGIDGYEAVRVINQNAGNFERVYACCPAGKKVIGGGAEALGNDAILVASMPTDDNTGWYGVGRQNAYPTVGMSVVAFCAYV